MTNLKKKPKQSPTKSDNVAGRKRTIADSVTKNGEIAEANKPEKVIKESVRPKRRKVDVAPKKEKAAVKAPKEKITKPKSKAKIVAKPEEKTEPETVPTEKEAEIISGMVMTVGTGDIGQLGLGPDIEARTRPTTVTLPSSIKAICAGGMHTVALTDKGEIYTFGCNDEGAIGRDSSEEGSEYIPAKVELDAVIKQISAGDSHTATLTNDGRVYLWGNFRNADGAMGLFRKDEKELRPRLITLAEKVTQIASGSDHLVMLTEAGDIYTCGNGQQGQLGRVAECFSDKGGRKGLDLLLIPAIIRVARRLGKKVSFDAIWAGACATFARAKVSKDIYASGLNNYQQLGLDVTNNIYLLQIIPSLCKKPWKQFTCGDHHTIGLTEEGEVYAIGRNNYGRLGLGAEAQDVKVPTLLPTFKNDPCVAVSSSVSSSFAVTRSGEVYAWGLGNSGQLGQGNEEDVWEPTKMNGKQLANRKVLAVSGGGQHAVLLVVESE
ncbi:Regulator of chromosome condensation [Chamberlinius hualienensis]